jgi:DNA repair protein RecN (Recombination protein N)
MGMLSELVVENLGPIASAEIVLQKGSSALTGETGAGKTLLVTAVTLLVGGRADRGIVRDGTDEARVEGRFVVPEDHPAVSLLHARELVDGPTAPVEVVVTRTISASGSRARINGRLVPASVLAEVGPLLVEIAGQHEHHRFGSPRVQREILDIVAGSRAVALAAEISSTVKELVRTERELEQLRAGERERARELDILRFEIDEIEGVGVHPGETKELLAEANRLENAGELEGGIADALENLSGDAGAEERLAAASAALERVSASDPTMSQAVERLSAAAAEIRDVAAGLSTQTHEPDPAALERVRARLDDLGRLRRKYGDDEAQIAEYLDRSRARADELGSKNDSVGDLEAAAKELRTRAIGVAGELSAMRKKAVPKLQKKVESLLADLAMSGSRFVVTIGRTDLYEGGLESVTFEIATGPGEKPRPMTKVASGGELSRVALALHLVAGGSGAETMIFDEVDAGVGGAAARAVGAALARLGREDSQVLVVTHLPQVAAFADAHYRIQRRDGERRDVVVERVERDERVEELSRMLAGLPESERAREHAQELLDLAAAGAES